MGFRSLIRVSEQIRRFAMGIVNGMEIDDLDGGVAVTDGDHSTFKGIEAFPFFTYGPSFARNAESL